MYLRSATVHLKALKAHLKVRNVSNGVAGVGGGGPVQVGWSKRARLDFFL